MKLLIIFLTISLVVSKVSADDGIDASNKLLNLMKEGEEAIKDSGEVNGEVIPLSSKKEEAYKEMLSLVDEVEQLKSKVVATKQNTLATSQMNERKKEGSITYYNYSKGTIYELFAGVDRVSDIVLQEGEKLTNDPISGDTVRWKVVSTESGMGSNQVTHILVKPLEEKIETNFIITTNRRTYHIKAVATDWYMPQISWNYPDDEFLKIKQESIKRKEIESNQEEINFSAEDLDFKYQISGDEFFTPIRVFNDGAKTYIQMPSNVENREAPALFIVEDKSVLLTNYRVKGDYYIYDGIFNTAQLRIRQEQIVNIYKEGFGPSLFRRIFG